MGNDIAASIQYDSVGASFGELANDEFRGSGSRTYRDDPDCALSMSRHAGYRTAALVDEILRLGGVRTPAEVDEAELELLSPDLARLWREDFLTAFELEWTIPPDRYGAMWSSMVEEGMALVGGVPLDHWLSLAYKALAANPTSELRRIASFVGVRAVPKRLDRADAVVDRNRAGAVGQIPISGRNTLTDACSLGQRLLVGDR